jgi:phenylalanyl-tRNA synthetase beta chain
MIVSVNWLKKFTEIDVPIDELAELIGSRLVEVEEVIDLGKKYDGIVVVKVIKAEKHPNADKLNVCLVDDGGVVSNVSRNEDGYIEIVCGAPNVRAGINAAWLPPGSTVPATADLAEPLVLTARELRGVISNGMLASSRELAIGDEHDGIVELNPELKPGSPFAPALELDDYLLDIENKSLTHRPDAFGIIGFAREVAAIQGKQFVSPVWYTALQPVLAEKKEVSAIKNPRVTIADPALCPRYEAVVIANVDPQSPSPLIIQSYLKRVGIRPINEVVDITNYLMVVSGQPTHAFDYDAFVSIGGTDQAEIVVRAAKQDEKLKLLDGREISMTPEDIVIVSRDTPVGLAGAMGGAESEITDETKNIIIESATFNMYNVKSTAMRHAVFTDAATRFTKGQPAAQTAPVLASAIRMMTDIAEGWRASDIIDEYPGKTDPVTVNVTIEQINNLLGTNLSVQAITKTLENAEFIIEEQDENLKIRAPYWRNDIHIPEDIIEEVGRLRGFDLVDPELPKRLYKAVTSTGFEQFRTKIRNALVRAGANEVLTYGFVHGKLLQKANQDPENAFKIVNAISPDLQHYRLSLVPSLLDKVHPNIKQGYDHFAIFEFNKVHQKDLMDKAEKEIPAELQHLALVVTADAKIADKIMQGAAYYEAKYLLEFLAASLKLPLNFVPLGDVKDASAIWSAPYEPKRSAVIQSNGRDVGIVGEFKRPVAKSFKLPKFAAGFEIDLNELFEASSQAGTTYKALSRYPGTELDICLRVNAGITYRQIVSAAQKVLDATSLEWHVEPVDIYQKSEDAPQKQVTIRVKLTDHSKTITTAEANEVIERIATEAKQTLDAEKV